MKWKRYSYNYDISSAGLFRLRVDVGTRVKGELLSPRSDDHGRGVYRTKQGGKYKDVYIGKAVRKSFNKRASFGQTWVDSVRVYADNYNKFLTMGFYSPTFSTGESPMWDHKSQSDIWLTYRADWCIGHVTDAQLCPMG